MSGYIARAKARRVECFGSRRPPHTDGTCRSCGNPVETYLPVSEERAEWSALQGRYVSYLAKPHYTTGEAV